MPFPTGRCRIPCRGGIFSRSSLSGRPPAGGSAPRQCRSAGPPAPGSAPGRRKPWKIRPGWRAALRKGPRRGQAGMPGPVCRKDRRTGDRGGSSGSVFSCSSSHARSLVLTFSRSSVRCSGFRSACSFACSSRSRMAGFSSRPILRPANSWKAAVMASASRLLKKTR